MVQARERTGRESLEVEGQETTREKMLKEEAGTRRLGGDSWEEAARMNLPIDGAPWEDEIGWRKGVAGKNLEL